MEVNWEKIMAWLWQMYMNLEFQSKKHLSGDIFCSEKTLFYFGKIIGQWILEDQGRGITRDILKVHFQFQLSTKTLYKIGTLYKSKNAGEGSVL